MFGDYMKKKLGPILMKDENGELKPDFGFYKRKP